MIDLYVTDDFEQYQSIPVTEDKVFHLNYCTPNEVRCLAKLIKACGAKTVLEIGTQAGMTACYLSKNLAPGGVLYTIDIAMHMQASEEVLEDQKREILRIDEVGWYYREQRCKNIVQIIGDSRIFKYRDVGIERIDVCFVDGNHTADAVYRDVTNVLNYMDDGSCLVWHDFEGISSPDKDVKGALSKLLCEGVLKAPIRAIAGTRMAYTFL